MMKAILASGIALIAAPLLASPAMPQLPGVADRETIIPYGDVDQSVLGHGDVLFVKDRSNRWYRLQLNPGCLGLTTDVNLLVFNQHGANQEIDRFTTIHVPEEVRTCSIESIRGSLPPQKIDSRSPVTGD